MATQQDYNALVAELEAIEKKYGGIYLTDVCVDRENVLVNGMTEFVADPELEGYVMYHPEFWSNMILVAQDAAGIRAEEHGLDINKELGRNIY